ncbi:hypothetical protein BX600DRAFT_415329 [Xylariales sp. PMI_506]|nr:hypothetical protein BX600DRAFT_415329 [Xylariales sp. PMI_506]
MPFKRLIRFIDTHGAVHYGEPVIDSALELHEQLAKGALQAKVLTPIGGKWLDFEPLGDSSQAIGVKQLLGPLTADSVPLIRCVGLNYLQHIKEGGRTPPPYPSIFIKPSDATAGWDETIPVPKIAQGSQLDYEGELAIVIGRDGKDIAEEDALDYIAGYTVSNDVSVRKWQRDPAFAGGVPQWCFSKGFDKFCPMGPMLVSPKILGAADNLALKTHVNGELRQNSNTSDLLFGVTRIVSFCSQGTTLARGSVILTGTPSGVALGMAIPKWLEDGDIVTVSIDGIGSISNKLEFV